MAAFAQPVGFSVRQRPIPSASVRRRRAGSSGLRPYSANRKSPHMLRINELFLPLEHTEEDLNAAILERLGIKADELVSFTLFRRSYDARKKAAVTLTYTIDVEVKDEAQVLERNKKKTNVGPTPDTGYHFVGRAPANLKQRPVVIGFGPCGLFAALLLAEMGFNPIILERGKTVRERTKDTWGLWRQRELKPESNVQFGEGGAGTFSDGKLTARSRTPSITAARCSRNSSPPMRRPRSCTSASRTSAPSAW